MRECMAFGTSSSSTRRYGPAWSVVPDLSAFAGAEHVRAEFSTYSWLLEPLLAAAGVEILDATHTRRLCATYTCQRRGPA
jgi:hypothetical protein